MGFDFLVRLDFRMLAAVLCIFFALFGIRENDFSNMKVSSGIICFGGISDVLVGGIGVFCG